MNESKLRRDLVSCLRKVFPGAVVFSHEDEFTAGIPDVSFTWAGPKYSGTTWLELKHVTPKKPFKSSDLQRETSVSLSNFTSAWYVVYEEKIIYKSIVDTAPIMGNMTYIIDPSLCENWQKGRAGDGFSHYFVAEFLKEIYIG